MTQLEPGQSATVVGWRTLTPGSQEHEEMEFNYQNREHIERAIGLIVAHAPRAVDSRLRHILGELVEAVRPKPSEHDASS